MHKCSTEPRLQPHNSQLNQQLSNSVAMSDSMFRDLSLFYPEHLWKGQFSRIFAGRKRQIQCWLKSRILNWEFFSFDGGVIGLSGLMKDLKGISSPTQPNQSDGERKMCLLYQLLHSLMWSPAGTEPQTDLIGACMDRVFLTVIFKSCALWCAGDHLAHTW